ncbi:Hypothetical predicted protein [Pelobates cultripes]|uniref:Uncharacterized protein n=1 Tax=Pelobates cultripes TaxID=61616 RepID=A0AAD1TJG4_PELCU|nr:Hypothetical predicted protein [Pelobates cultripes]
MVLPPPPVGPTWSADRASRGRGPCVKAPVGRRDRKHSTLRPELKAHTRDRWRHTPRSRISGGSEEVEQADLLKPLSSKLTRTAEERRQEPGTQNPEQWKQRA